jgi:hypothetical protein
MDVKLSILVLFAFMCSLGECLLCEGWVMAISVIPIPLGVALENSEPVVSPTPTAVPPNPSQPVQNQTFILKDDDNNSVVCLRMEAVITVNLTYINASGVS